MERLRILGVPVDMVNYEQAMERFVEIMGRAGCELIVTPNSEIVVNAGEDKELFRIIEGASLVIPDGIGLVYASKILGQPLSERVTGVDFLNKILKWLEDNQKSIFLFGSKPESRERASVADLAAAAMKEKYPNLLVAGTHDGYFSIEEESGIVEKINASGAEFLCVALGSPKQEKFVWEHRQKFTNVRCAIGVGGSLDVWAGTVKRAPEFYQKHGLEWLYRFAKEPSRAGRMAKLPLFMGKVIVSGKSEKKKAAGAPEKKAFSEESKRPSEKNRDKPTGKPEKKTFAGEAQSNPEKHMQKTRQIKGKETVKMDYAKYEQIAKNVRAGIIKAVSAAGSGHPGGSLSAADIVTALYFKEMNIDPQNPKMEGRDKFILSKGHAGPVQYAALALRGYYKPEEVLSLRKIGSKFQGHPDMRKVPGIEMSTGSLGQGFAAAGGMAVAAKLDKSDARVYVLLGDGELQEGIVWESAMSSAHYGLDNLCAIVDWNGLQIDGANDKVMKVAPIAAKFAAFGWNVISIDGHDFAQIFEAFDNARACKGKPTMIVAKTCKGKGVSFMEDNYGWHGKAPNAEETEKALAEIGGEF